MKKLILFLVISLLAFYQSHSQQLVVDNQIDCYLIIDLDDDCDARTGGPYDCPANQVSYHDLSTDGISSPNDIETFVIEKQSNGDNDIVKFTAICQASPDTSPHTLDNSLIQCLTNDIVVEWQVNGSDFEIYVHY